MSKKSVWLHLKKDKKIILPRVKRFFDLDGVKRVVVIASLGGTGHSVQEEQHHLGLLKRIPHHVHKVRDGLLPFGRNGRSPGRDKVVSGIVSSLDGAFELGSWLITRSPVDYLASRKLIQNSGYLDGSLRQRNQKKNVPE